MLPPFVRPFLLAVAGSMLWPRLAAASDTGMQVVPAGDPQSVVLADASGAATIIVDAKDASVVTLAANLFADDVACVTGKRPAVADKPSGKQVIVAGTLGRSGLIDQLVSGGRLKNANEIRGRWEATLTQVVDRPWPGVERALVIVGSDRRGTAYGLMQLSEKIGVSPWYWWADVPTKHRDSLAVKLSTPQSDAPGVKYRGIFINDEDWGINPWARTTFDPEFKNIGPKTYGKVFELMLRLRLNYFWPAMHGCSTEFDMVPENALLADRYAIVAGSSHCEPMLRNNIRWDPKTCGAWNYGTNRDAIHTYWEESAKTRGQEEAVWTLGIRGIHDAAMNGPKDMPGRLDLVTRVIGDQRALLNQYVTKQWGPVAQCFIPYKEVQVIYDAGLQVPPDVTILWADDNFGYLRRLSSPQERQRPGGAGFYYHLSYYGHPHSYTWINTTAPALMWEEMHKAWENEARTIWMLNVGDIKPGEIGIDYFSRLAWHPDAFGPDSQPLFLRDFAARNFGENNTQPLADFLMEYYRLGTVRKPELMNREWAASLPVDEIRKLEDDYRTLLRKEESLAAAIPPEARDAYIETIGFAARVLGSTGLIFAADRKGQEGKDAAACEQEIARLRSGLEDQVKNFNTRLAHGKWNLMMPGLVTGKFLDAWNSQVSWPWGEKSARPEAVAPTKPDALPAGQGWRDAASADRQTEGTGGARWTSVSGLGPSGRAMSLQPAKLTAAWPVGDAGAPGLEYAFQTGAGDAAAFIDFLPTFRLVPGMKSRVGVRVDNGSLEAVEVPGSSGTESENGPVRQSAVQDNFVRLRVPMPGLSAGRHTFRISAIDPATVINRVSLPAEPR